jgi:hypothetical protein
MMQQKPQLYSKIKIANESHKPDFYALRLPFYSNYSRFVLKALRKSSFQEFINWMLLSENIEQIAVNSVDVKVFPAPRKNGYNLVGKCNTLNGKIRIYPKTSNFYFAFKKKFGKSVLTAFLGNRARAALIHELLHLKYAGDEQKVRELTEAYFSLYLKKWSHKNSDSLQCLIFNSKSAFSASP